LIPFKPKYIAQVSCRHCRARLDLNEKNILGDHASSVVEHFGVVTRIHYFECRKCHKLSTVSRAVNNGINIFLEDLEEWENSINFIDTVMY